jgi:S1-C subfamily serine protease
LVSDFNKIKLGQRVFLTAFSSTKANDWLINEGIIKSFDEDTIKTNISEKSIINGSPLFNIYGGLVGLNYIDSDNKVSAVPINIIKSFLEL